MSGSPSFWSKFSRSRRLKRALSRDSRHAIIGNEDARDERHSVLPSLRHRCLALLASSIVANHKPTVHSDAGPVGSNDVKAVIFEDRPSSGPHKKRKTNESLPSKGTPAPVEPVAPRPSQPLPPTMSPLMQSFRKKLDGARFRWINEQLYTQTGAASLEEFRKDPSIFDAYHAGFREQVSKWPVNPVNVIIDVIKRKHPPPSVIGDFGCGDAKLAASVPNVTHSFDLQAVNDRVTVCDVAHVPLEAASLDVAVFSLALMGTNWMDFIKEAARVVKTGGTLIIAEVRSRFTSGPGDARPVGKGQSSKSSKARHGQSGVREPEQAGLSAFVSTVESFGFKLTSTDASNKMFVLFTLTRSARAGAAANRTPKATLKACTYKKR